VPGQRSLRFPLPLSKGITGSIFDRALPMSQSRLVSVERLRELIATADPEVACALSELLAIKERRKASRELNRASNALRQKRFRQRRAAVTALRNGAVTDSNKNNDLDRNAVTSNAHVTNVNEINEVDRNAVTRDTSTLTYLLKKERKKEEDSKEERKIRGAHKKGFRLPDDWNPREADFAMAVARLNGSAKLELEKFRDYWKAQPGQRGTKLDWDATFRNWVRNAKGGGEKPRAFDVRRHLV